MMRFFFLMLLRILGRCSSTSADSILDSAKHLFITFISVSSLCSLSSSPKNVSNILDSIPVFPMLPISSLSTSRHTAVFSGFSVSSIACSEVYAHTLSSCPYPPTILLSKPRLFALNAGTISNSALMKSFSTMPYFSFNIFIIFSFTFSQYKKYNCSVHTEISF